MGYCKALQINGLREHEEWVIDDREKDGYGYLLDFVLPAELPTAFVCNCDKCAYILIDKLRRRGTVYRRIYRWPGLIIFIRVQVRSRSC